MARTPLYKAAETEMIRRIEAREWEVGKRLPNEFVLAKEFKVSQGTMRRALITLEGMGLLSRKPGRGTIVAQPGVGAVAGASSGQILFDGKPVSFDIHRAKSGLRGANDGEASLFGTGRLSHVERLLKRGGTRIGTEDIAVPENVSPALNEDGPLDFTAFLTAEGIAAATLTESVSADITTMNESVALSCDRHTPLLVVTRTARNEDGAAIARQVMRLIANGLTYG